MNSIRWRRDMDLQMRGKRFLVVGGTAGIGLAAASVLAAEGASIAVIGRNQQRLDEAVEHLCVGATSEVFGVRGDVSTHAGALDAVNRAVEFLGGLNGVAITTGLIGHEPIAISDARWVEVFSDVFMGTVRVVEACLPYLVSTQGSIVTTAAYSIRAPEIARLPYASMKSAVATFTKGIAKAYGQEGVRANCVAPGAIETASLTALRRHVSETKGIPYNEALERVMVDEWHLDIALQRPGRATEVGNLIAFVLSDLAAYMTGTLINIDGGTNF